MQYLILIKKFLIAICPIEQQWGCDYNFLLNSYNLLLLLCSYIFKKGQSVLQNLSFIMNLPVNILVRPPF